MLKHRVVAAVACLLFVGLLGSLGSTPAYAYTDRLCVHRLLQGPNGVLEHYQPNTGTIVGMAGICPEWSHEVSAFVAVEGLEPNTEYDVHLFFLKDLETGETMGSGGPLSRGQRIITNAYGAGYTYGEADTGAGHWLVQVLVKRTDDFSLDSSFVTEPFLLIVP